MMRHQALRLGIAMAALLLLAGCGGAQYRRADLQHRFQRQLGQELGDRQAALQPLPDGVRLSIADDALFSPGTATLTGHGRYVLASAIESLLAPPVLHIEVSGPPGTPTPLQQARVQAVSDFLQDFQIGPALQPATMEAQTVAGAGPGTPAPALYMTVTLRQR